MPRQNFTLAEKHHLLDLVENGEDYAMTQASLARYLLLFADECPALVDMAHYFIDFPEGESEDA